MGRLVPSRTPEQMGLVKYEKIVDGKKRYWYVYEPSSYKKGTQKKYPAVMAIPGYSCNAEYLAQISDWHVVGEKRDFFVIYPSAYPGSTPSNCVPLPMWKSGKLFAEDPQDDVPYLKELMEDMCERYPLDHSRLYVSGHSNGSKMTQDLMHDCPGLFAACAPIGFVYGELNTECLEEMPDTICPIWYIKGEYDLDIACDMSPELANQKMIDLLCKVNRASPEPVFYNNGKYENRLYYNDHHIPVVRFTKAVDMPHAQTPEMSVMIWDEFFSRITRQPDGSITYIW